MVYTSRIRGNACRRPRAFWGALIPAAINFVGGLITSSQQAKAQKRALEEQQRLAQQQLQISNQNNLATTLNNYASANNSYSDEDYNLKYRNGGTRRLGSNGITITDGGNAIRIGNNTYLLRGGSHEDINETGQTGIGINVGGNEIEAEGGEVAQKKNKSLRIFSAQPMLSGGLSPAQAIIRGYNKDKVFAAQQKFKKNNGIKDDGSKASFGNLITMPFAGIVKDIVDYFSNNGKYAPIGKYNNYSTAKETNAKKEALNRRVGARRIAKRMGGLTNTPVGSRRKYLPGGTANPWDEYKVSDYGGVAPWQVSNKYDVNVPYPIGKYDLPITTITAKKDTFNDEMSRRMRAGVQNLKDDSNSKTTVPYLGRQNTFKPATQDYIGLGIDTLAALGSGLFTRSAYNKMNFDYALPNYVDESPVAFDTIYHNEAQRANVERNRLNSRNLIRDNTSSAQTALGRMQQTDIDAMMELNKLADEKANKEVELRNQNAANEQQVRARNAAARNQYYQNVAQIKNAALEAKNNAALAKAQSIGADLSGLSQAWTNFAGSVEQRYNTRQNEAIIAATSKEPAVLSNALQFGYNFSPEVLASIYRSTNDDKLKQLALSRLSPSDRRRYSLFQ